MPTRKDKRSYIGGTTSEARKKYFNYDKELTQIVTNLATSYGISPALAIDRLAHEGLIDRAIINNNLISTGNIVDVFGPSLFSNNNNSTYNSPYGLLGLDIIYDTYSKGITKTKRPINIRKMTTRNESGETVNSGETKNLYDTLELFTAELASRRNQVKQQYPNLTDTELDSATAARYNATNRYFKQLMESGDYKSKYPIDVEGVNIPTPTKIDSKYIQDQTHTVNMDRAFRTAPKEIFIYNDKSWNPKLFMTDGYIDEPESPIVKHFLNNYAVQNFTQPNKVNFIQEKYKCGGRRKAQLGLDIREGGIAIPIANNMYYMDGRSHDNGGIAIGPNNKNGLEVEGGEVVKVGKNDVKVFSSVPLLRGVSPAQLVMEGANPNKVFKAQEDFKDRNRINDDGTTYEVGGEKIYTPSKSIQRQIQETGRIIIGGSPTIGGIRTAKYVRGLANAKSYAKQANKIFTKVDNLVNNGLQGLINKHKITPNQADAYKKFYDEIVGVNGVNIPKTASFFLNNDNREMKFGGSMIYTINGNVKNGLMSARPKAKYGLASKYLKKKNSNTQKPVETKQKEEPKILDIRNTAGYKIKQVAENPWVKYPVEVASYLLTGATAKGMQTGAKVTNKVVNKIDDILGKPRQEYLSRNISDKTIKVGTIENPIRPKDSSRITKVYKPTINEISQARQAARPKPEPKIKSIDKIYKQVIGNKEPRSTVGNVPQWTEISYSPTNRTVTAYDASAEFHKRISDMLYDSYVKKYGKKAVDKAMKSEHISKYEYGGRIKAKNGKFLKYKNGVFTDPETGEEYDVDPEVFKMYGNTKESGVIPTADYTKGTFNARPQYYAKKQLPIAGDQSIAEKAGLARSGWSYSDSPTFDYAPNINISVPTNYAKAVGDNTKKSTSSTARGRGTKASTPKAAAKTTTKDADVKYSTPLKEKKESLYMTGIKNNSITPLRAGMEKIKSHSSTGGGTQSKDGRWIGQYKTTNVGDWIGLGSNLAGSVASYFMTKNAINKMPEPIKPIMAQAVKLKTRYNVEPQLSEIREAEQMNRAAVRRNTQSSNTSLAREQRLLNEARGARNTLYGQKENIETQLINQDRLNRQSVMRDNIRAYNEYLNRVTATKIAQNEMRASNINNLISGLTGSVSNILGTIESRRATNNALRAIAAANPNVDARLIGGFDYYIDPITKKKYNKNQQYVGTING